MEPANASRRDGRARFQSVNQWTVTAAQNFLFVSRRETKEKVWEGAPSAAINRGPWAAATSLREYSGAGKTQRLSSQAAGKS